MVNKLVKIKYDTNEIILSSYCFFNEAELERMGIIVDEPFEQNGKEYIYKLINE